jgi:hypothetical protein
VRKLVLWLPWVLWMRWEWDESSCGGCEDEEGVGEEEVAGGKHVLKIHY